MYTEEQVRHLRKMAVRIRSNILEMIPPGKVGHLGGSSSIADILAVLYFSRMRHLDPHNPKDPERDRLILSKGHAVLGQYAALVELGYFSREELHKVKTLHGVLQGHPDIEKTPGLEAVTGSLGQGLSVSSGIAMALKLDKSNSKVFCICGDGEMSEGQIWEAAMSCVNYKLDNLCVFVDLNCVQATGTTAEIFSIQNIPDRFRSFGWNVLEIDGHDIPQILDGIDLADRKKGLPTVIVAHTIKGKGFPFAEGKAQYHNAALTDAEYAEGKRCIERMEQEASK